MTQSFTPSNVSAPPAWPAVVRVAPEITPPLPTPDESMTPDPGLLEAVCGDQTVLGGDAEP